MRVSQNWLKANDRRAPGRGSGTEGCTNLPWCFFDLLDFILVLFVLSWMSSCVGEKHGHADHVVGIVEEESFDFCQGAAMYSPSFTAKLV